MEEELKQLRRSSLLINATKAFLAVFLIGEAWKIAKEPNNPLETATDWSSRLAMWVSKMTPDWVYLVLIIFFLGVALLLGAMAFTNRWQRQKQIVIKTLAAPLGIVIFAGFGIDWLKGLPVLAPLLPGWLFSSVVYIGFLFFFVIGVYEAIVFPVSESKISANQKPKLFVRFRDWVLTVMRRYRIWLNKWSSPILRFAIAVTGLFLLAIGVALVLGGFKVVGIVPVDAALIGAGVALFGLGLVFWDRGINREK